MQPTGPSDPPDPPALPGDEPAAPADPPGPAPAFAPFFVPPPSPSAPAWPTSAASGHDASWGAPPPAPPGPPLADAAPLAPPVASQPIVPLPPGYGASAPGVPLGPHWIPSAALPPGYEPDSSGGQPDVVLFFRIYAGLVCLGGASAACWGLYEGVQRMHYGGFQLIGPVFYGILGVFLFAAYLLGVVLPRRSWMHTVGIIQLGLGILGSCCS